MLRSGARSSPATFGVLSALLAALIVSFAQTASAQNAPDEALIGVIEIGADAESNSADAVTSDGASGDTSASATEPQDFENRRHSAAGTSGQVQVFGDAMRALGRGQLASAQRLLETVIVLDPDSETADEARRNLAALYRGDAKSSLSGRDADALPWRTGSSAPPATAPVLQPAAGEAALPPRSAVSEELERRFITEAGDRVFFSEASADLGSRARAVLSAQAQWLAKRPELDVMIEGYADDAPMGAAEQDELSERRAEVVRQRLIAEGIDPQRLGIAPWGRDRRISECNEPSCAVQNRRAVTVLVMRQGSRARAPVGAAIDVAPAAPRTGVDWVR